HRRIRLRAEDECSGTSCGPECYSLLPSVVACSGSSAAACPRHRRECHRNSAILSEQFSSPDAKTMNRLLCQLLFRKSSTGQSVEIPVPRRFCLFEPEGHKPQPKAGRTWTSMRQTFASS